MYWVNTSKGTSGIQILNFFLLKENAPDNTYPVCRGNFPWDRDKTHLFLRVWTWGSFNYFSGRQTLCFEADKWWQSKQQWVWIKSLFIQKERTWGEGVSLLGPAPQTVTRSPRGRRQTWTLKLPGQGWVRPDSSEERPSGPAALPGGLSRPSTPTFPGKLFKMQNSPSLSLQDTVHNYPFSMSYLIEKDSLKKKNWFHPWKEFQRTHVGKPETHVCGMYLEKDVLVSFKDCHVFSQEKQIFICYL